MEYIQMDYQQFEDAVRNYFQEKYGEDGTCIQSVWKNNGVRRRCLICRQKGERAVPAVYLEEFFQKLKRGIPLAELMKQIEKTYKERKLSTDMNMDDFLNYEKIKQNLCIKLIHFEKNQQFLEKVPFLPFLDLAVVCYGLIDNASIQNGSVVIHQQHLDAWGLTKEELFRQALENSRKLSPEMLLDMPGLFGLQKELERREESLDGYTQMYVLTTSRLVYGAAAICYPGVLKQFGEQIQSDFYLLPSSIHEVILVPEAESSLEKLGRMVKEVNEEQVLEEEILSGDVYFYSRAESVLKNLSTGKVQSVEDWTA